MAQRVPPLIGFIGAPLLVASVIATLFDLRGQRSAMAAVLTIPIAVLEFSLKPRRRHLSTASKPTPPDLVGMVYRGAVPCRCSRYLLAFLDARRYRDTVPARGRALSGPRSRR